MAVTDIVRPVYGYDTDWSDPEIPDLAHAIEKYNRNAGRFMFFPWGCWVTAYARRNLFTGIMEFENDYIYSDTDSIKVLHEADHKPYIEDYNRRILKQLRRAMDHHALDPDLIQPKNKRGEEKPLGVWSFDGHYERFKTLGAKRYMVKYSDDPRNGGDAGKWSLTVAGLAKRTAMPYLLERSKDPMTLFTNQMHIPAGCTGKLTHTYIDDPTSGVLVDYRGVPGRYSEQSSVNLSPADYSLSMAREYVNYLTNLKTEVY